MLICLFVRLSRIECQLALGQSKEHVINFSERIIISYVNVKSLEYGFLYYIIQTSSTKNQQTRPISLIYLLYFSNFPNKMLYIALKIVDKRTEGYIFKMNQLSTILIQI